MNLERLLFLPSTPLNVLLSAAFALQQDSQTVMELWLIDQRKMDNNPYSKALLDWKQSPFKQIKLLPGQAKGLQKLKERRQNFATLRDGLEQFKPNQIMVGSDRRIEFQYAMHYLKEIGESVNGVYLDDGLYSYAGREASLFKDGFNALLKKLSYGLWWEEPKTVGASSLIHQAWLFQPSLAVEALQKKSLMTINVNWFKSSELLGLSHSLATVLGVNTEKIREVDLLVLIPHPNNIKKIPNYAARLKQRIIQEIATGKKVGVKYHPRMPADDVLNLKSLGVYDIVPAQMAFEFCLPMLAKDCIVLGDIGTALLTTKWLRPEIEVQAVLDKNDDFQKRFIALTQSMNIDIISNYSNSQ